MKTGKSTIKEIFDGTRVFNIPVYQRTYSWEVEENLKDFLSDIVNQHEDRNYFLGSLLFHINGTRNKFTVIDIVDGQQRLTTFIIFINTLIKKLLLNSSNSVSKDTISTFVKDVDVFKLETSNEDCSFLHNAIFGDENSEFVDIKTNSQRLLLEAKSYFIEELDKFDNATLERIYITAVNTDVLLYVVDKINTATQIFELLNDRGRKLTDLESIKSFLMYNTGLVSEHPDQIIRNIQLDFSEIYRLVEKHEINDRDVLRYHNIAFESCPADFQEKPKEFIKSKITKLVNTPDTKAEALSEIKSYAKRLKNSFIIYSKIQVEKQSNLNLAHLFMIGRVAPYYPVLMKVYKDESEKFDSLLLAIRQFTFKASLVGLRSNGESYLYTRLRRNEDVIDLVRNFIENNWWDINKRAIEAIEYENYYERLSKNSVRYILVSYENKLRKAKGFPLITLKEYFTIIEREKLSIEHISAQRAKDVDYDDEFHERYKHSIGNLVIDYVASNSSKGNKNTKDKLAAFNLAPLMSQNEINGTSCDWSEVESIKCFINQRELIIKDFILTHFQLNS
ncbi:MAG: DUF262 domain-containing protein [Colwellia polaris]